MKILNKEELNKLPQEVIEEVKSTLKAYDECNIVFEFGKYKVMVGQLLKAEYGKDFEVIGEVRADDIYDTNDKIINYIEGFMSYPREYKGKKNWAMIRELEELRRNRKKGIISLDNEGNAIIKEIVELKF